ncbi:hypothetical protein Ae168Ps1_5309 [Pseudonocardia sp. Ae168_Ps1]|nr:hypothetical protein Ae168Ps1_5309 [Pseudonocardia sp. Ae168_Ps1]
MGVQSDTRRLGQVVVAGLVIGAHILRGATGG